MKKNTILILFVCLSVVSFAQDVSEIKLNLKIIDKKSKNFAYAAIYLTETETGDTLKNRLDADGSTYFYVNKSNSYQIFIQNKLVQSKLGLEAIVGKETTVKLQVDNSYPTPSASEDTIFQSISIKQKSTRNLQLMRFQVIDPQNRTLPNVSIQLIDEKTKRRFISSSDEAGLVRFLLPEGDYQMIAEDNIDYPIVKVRRKTGMLVTEFVCLRTTPVVETVVNDTITQSFPVRILPSYAKTQLTVRIADKRDVYLPNEMVYLNLDSTNTVYKGTTDLTGVVHFLLPKGHTYYVHTSCERNIEAVVIPSEKSKLRIELNYSYYAAEMMRRQAEIKMSSGAGSSGYVFDDKIPTDADSVVFMQLNRMKNIKKKLIVTDLTGSMYPYASQLLAWYKLNYAQDTKADLVFFNDGDRKPDDKKKIGNTGGIYSCYQCVYDSCLKTMMKTADAGSGGDTPENNLEALIFAIKNVRSYDALIMIADNYATPRDMELLKKIKIPVKVIVCGAVGGAINTAYLKIARDTKGAVYTMEKELLNLAQLHEGELLEIGDKVYRIKNGEFQYMKNKSPKYKLK